MFWWRNFSEYWAFARFTNHTPPSDLAADTASGLLPWNVTKSVLVWKMTISYGQQVATSSGLGVFWKLLFLWRGSIYKLVWTNLALYIFLYYSLSLTYRFLLDVNGRVTLQSISNIIKHWLLIGIMFPGKVWATIPSLSKVRRLDSSDICAWILC